MRGEFWKFWDGSYSKFKSNLAEVAYIQPSEYLPWTEMHFSIQDLKVAE